MPIGLLAYIFNQSNPNNFGSVLQKSIAPYSFDFEQKNLVLRIWVICISKLKLFLKIRLSSLCPEAIVISVWKTAICKWGVCIQSISKHPVFNDLSFRGRIKHIFDTVDWCNFVINELNPTSEVQTMGNGTFQNAPFWNAPFANGCIPNCDYSCLWA